jgi:hypothetical protein
MNPHPPRSLNAFAKELLDLLAGHPEAAEIVIGGGVALAHYLDYRDTFDLDAWWRTAPVEAAEGLMAESMQVIAARHGLGFNQRSWGETKSFELLREGRKVFSLQIAKRGLFLEEALPAAWAPVMIETLQDNVASKMTALVERGAPRDLRDIYELCNRGFVSPEKCWHLYTRKNPSQTTSMGAVKVLFAVERLELQRPLDTISDAILRDQAARLRSWYREVFCHSSGR